MAIGSSWPRLKTPPPRRGHGYENGDGDEDAAAMEENMFPISRFYQAMATATANQPPRRSKPQMMPLVAAVFRCCCCHWMSLLLLVMLLLEPPTPVRVAAWLTLNWPTPSPSSRILSAKWKCISCLATILGQVFRGYSLIDS